MRSLEELYRENEILLHNIKTGSLTAKQIDGANTTLKQMKALGIDIPMRMVSLMEKFKGRDKMADAMKDMRAPMMRTVLGLPEIAGR